MGKPIIMGRKTWESLGRPLPGRVNIVMTRNLEYKAEGAVVVHTLEQALAEADAEEVMIIGGANLYTQALPAVDRLYLTRVDESFTGDAWFPVVDESEWTLTVTENHAADDKNPHAYCFEIYNRL